MAKLKLSSVDPNATPHVAKTGDMRAKVKASQKKHEASARKRRAVSFFLFFLVFGAAPAGAYFAYRSGHLQSTEPYIAKAQASWNELFGPTEEPIFRVAEKAMVPGYNIAKDMKKGDKSREWSDWVDPRFFIICQQSNTDLARYFELSEKDYNALRTGDHFLERDTQSWQPISSTEFDHASSREVKSNSFDRFPAIYIPPAGTCGPTTKCENP